MKSKKCETCDNMLVCAETDSARSWAMRRFCKPCLTIRHKPPRVTELKTCPKCGQQFGQNHGESYMRWRQRRFCAKNCSLEAKSCRNCGKEMTPGPNTTQQRWNEMSFCSWACRKTNRCTICERLSVLTPCAVCKQNGIELDVYEPTQTEIELMCDEFRKLRPREPIGGVPTADTQWIKPVGSSRRMVKMIGGK